MIGILSISFFFAHLVQANDWGKQLLAMRGPGYAQKSPITPYIHMLIYHVPDMLTKYGSLALFSGQGNYDLCKILEVEHFAVYLHVHIKSYSKMPKILTNFFQSTSFTNTSSCKFSNSCTVISLSFKAIKTFQEAIKIIPKQEKVLKGFLNCKVCDIR